MKIAYLVATCLAAVFGPLALKQPSASQRHYFAVFSWESQPYEAAKAHTFAAVFRDDGHNVEERTLSWLPASFRIQPPNAPPEKGLNLTLAESLDCAERNKLRVSVWGPFEVDEAFYNDFEKHAKRFRDGEALYRTTTAALAKDKALGAAHAVEAFYRNELTCLAPDSLGDRAAARIARELAVEYLKPEEVHPGILEKKGFGTYPFSRRSIETPKPKSAQSPLQPIQIEFKPPAASSKAKGKEGRLERILSAVLD